MIGHRLPMSELCAAMVARIAEALPTVPLYSLTPPNTARPYGEIKSLSWRDGSFKNLYRKEVITELGACSDQQNMVELNGILNSQIQALTGDPLTLDNEWVADFVDIEGGGEIHVEQDGIGLFWRGSYRLRWQIRETRAVGPR